MRKSDSIVMRDNGPCCGSCGACLIEASVPTAGKQDLALVEQVAREIESFMLGRVGIHVCRNAAKSVLGLREIAHAIRLRDECLTEGRRLAACFSIAADQVGVETGNQTPLSPSH